MHKYSKIILLIVFLIGGIFLVSATEKKAISYLIQTYKSGEAEIGMGVICPVLKTKSIVDEESLFTVIKGKKYYVCCDYCKQELESDSDKYLMDKAMPNIIEKKNNQHMYDSHSGHHH